MFILLMLTIITGVQLLSHQGDCCVIVKTPSDRPYIDHIHSQLGVALGGNGVSAKSSDEIGRIHKILIAYFTVDRHR